MYMTSARPRPRSSRCNPKSLWMPARLYFFVQLILELSCRNYVDSRCVYIFPAFGFGGGASSPACAEDATDHPRSVVRRCTVLHFNFWIGEPSHTHSPIRRVHHNYKCHLPVTKGKIRNTTHFHKINYELNLWNFTLFGREVVTVCSSSSVQWRKQNLEITHPDNMVNNQSRKEKEEGIIWNKVRTLLQDCTDVDALTQVGYIPMCFIHWKL